MNIYEEFERVVLEREAMRIRAENAESELHTLKHRFDYLFPLQNIKVEDVERSYATMQTVAYLKLQYFFSDDSFLYIPKEPHAIADWYMFHAEEIIKTHIYKISEELYRRREEIVKTQVRS